MISLPAQPARRASEQSGTRPPTVALIDLAALAHNVAVVRRAIPSSCQIIAVVKADAYGHGAAQVAQALSRMGVTRFAVATFAEGVLLRKARLSSPVLVMGGMQPEDYRAAVAHRLTPVVHDRSQLAALAGVLRRRARPYPIHLKVDTGMSRLGLSVEDVAAVLQESDWRHRLQVEGLMTHLADADNADPTFTDRQLDRFRSLVETVTTMGLRIPLIHAANSAAVLRHPASHFSAVRPGLMLYGYHTLADGESSPDLAPILTLTTKVVQVRRVAQGDSISYNRTHVASRPSRIAVLPVGYADGYNRLLSNRGAVLLEGQRAPIVGRICMDLTMVDVTEIPAVRTGSEAVLIGAQGELRVTADDLAALIGTIPYEILCAIGPRVPRFYLPSSP